MAMRRPRIWPAHMCPWACSASATYSSKDFIKWLQHSQRRRRELDQPLLIILLPPELLAGNLDRNVSGELKPHRLRLLRDAHQLRGNLVNLRFRAIVRPYTQIFGADAQPDPVTQQAPGKVCSGDLVILETQAAGVAAWIERRDFGLKQIWDTEQSRYLHVGRLLQDFSRRAALHDAAIADD